MNFQKFFVRELVKDKRESLQKVHLKSVKGTLIIYSYMKLVYKQ